MKHATTLANGFRGATLEWAKSSTAAARLAHAGSIGVCRAYRQAATAIRCLARVDHLSRPEQLVGAQFVFDDAITPRPVGRWLSGTDRSNSPWCRRPRPLDRSACGVTADLDAATPKPLTTGEGSAGFGRRKRAGIGASGALCARSCKGPRRAAFIGPALREMRANDS